MARAQLTDDEFFENAYASVVLYIKNNGGTPDDSKFTLKNNPAIDGKSIRITKWDYTTIIKPTVDDLKRLDLVDIKASRLEDENVPAKITEIKANNFSIYCLSQILKDYHSLTDTEVNTFLENNYKVFFGFT